MFSWLLKDEEVWNTVPMWDAEDIFLVGPYVHFFPVSFLLYNVLRSAGISVPCFIFFILPKVTSQIFLFFSLALWCLRWPSVHLQFSSPSNKPVMQVAFSHSSRCLRTKLIEYILLGRWQLYKWRFKWAAFSPIETFYFLQL